MNKYVCLLAVVGIVFFTSCRTAIQTVAPEEAFEEVRFSPQESSFVIPLVFSIQELQNLVNKYTEGVLYEDNNIEDDNFMVKVSKHSPITLSIIGNDVQFRVPLEVWLKGGIKVNTFGVSFSDYEEANGSLALTFRTKLDIDPFWNVRTTTSFVNYEWIKQPQFSIALLNFPFKIVANNIIQSEQKNISTIIDDQVRRNVDTRKYLETAWDYMHEPVKLITDPPTWLTIKPKGIFISPFIANAQELSLIVGMKAITETVVGRKPQVTKTNLPNFKIQEERNGSYNVQVSVQVDYEQITEMASKYLVGQMYTFNKGKKKVVIDKVNFYGDKDYMVISVLLSGSINGMVYLKGIPVYDPATRKVVFSKLDFDLDTKNKLHKSANWLAHDVMIKKMAPYFSYYIGDHLDEASKEIKSNITHKQLHANLLVEGTLDELKPEQFVLTKEGLIAVVNAKGQIKLFVTGIDKY